MAVQHLPRDQTDVLPRRDVRPHRQVTGLVRADFTVGAQQAGVEPTVACPRGRQGEFEVVHLRDRLPLLVERPGGGGEYQVLVNVDFQAQALPKWGCLAIHLEQHVAQGPALVIGQHPRTRSVWADQAELAVSVAGVHAVQVEALASVFSLNGHLHARLQQRQVGVARQDQLDVLGQVQPRLVVSHPGRPLGDGGGTALGDVNTSRAEQLIQTVLHHGHVYHATGC